MNQEPMEPKSLRFCMITTFYPPHNFGGDGIFVQRLAEALAQRGHHVSVIHCVDAYRLSGTPEPTRTVPHHANIEVHPLTSRAGPLSPLITHQLGAPGLKKHAIQSVLAQGNFDVIHFHNISLVGGPAVLAYGSAVKLYTAHEYWLLCPLSTLWKFGSEPCEEKSCTACTLQASRPPQLWRHSSMLEESLKHLDAIMAPSQFLIEKHHEMGLSADFVHMPNFLPVPKNPPELEGDLQKRANGRPFFLLVGRMEKSKGFQRAINLFQRFNQADLVIVGSGPFEATLQEMAAGHDHIRFLGHLSYETLIDLYHQAVAVIVPSIWFEPFGLIVLEAYAQHTPVIVNNAGALPELVAESDGGIVYRNDDELLAAVITLLENPEQRDTLGQKGYDALQRLWTEERYLQRYLRLIATIQEEKEQSN